MKTLKMIFMIALGLIAQAEPSSAKPTDSQSALLYCHTVSRQQTVVIEFNKLTYQVKAAKYNGRHNLSCLPTAAAVGNSKNLISLPTFQCVWDRTKYGIEDLKLTVGGEVYKMQLRRMDVVYPLYYMKADSFDGVNDSGVVCTLENY